jgi:DEAD/DEAH box helicase/Helicase conserved C-terminal domain
MDRIQKASNVINKINQFKNDEISEANLTGVICSYFDSIKEESLSPSDMKFLKYISNAIGIPHYYDLLVDKFQQNNSEYTDFGLNTMASIIYESTLHIDDNIKLHKHQKTILDQYRPLEQNRIFLSASTSFGKTYLVYEIVKKMQYKNIVLMFPTIALLSENLEKLKTDEYYQYFRDNYKIHTLSQIDDDELAENNIFIYTPERYLSFLDKNDYLDFDYIFMDEIYKIDNEYIIDNEEAKENERDIAYRVALYNALKNNTDMLLVGPYIEFSDINKENYNPSFFNFLKANNFILVDYNEYEIVNKTRNILEEIEHMKITKSMSKKDKLKSIFSYIMQKNENCIVYCLGSGTAESKTKEVLHLDLEPIDDEKLISLINHIKLSFHDEWIVVKALENGIGIHHGLVPKYIQKEIINLFNKGILKALFSTTTITEGVNTSAKNLIVFDHKKGKKDLKKFDAKNIEGRAGRFMHHYSGGVFVIDKKFNEIINSDEIGINHKNYDENSPKDQIDYFITDDKYLNHSDISEKMELLNKISQREIPIEILNAYKVISYSDKIKLYDIINNLTDNEHRQIKKLISAINGSSVNIDFDGFDMIVSLLILIVSNNDLYNLMNRKKHSPINNKEHSVMTFLLHAYLTYGFKGLIDYKINIQKINVDKAMQESSKFVYNTLKYQLVKYLGVFNSLYKFIRAKKENKKDVAGIDKLLSKLEHNAFTKAGKLAADYGVPYKIVQYYDLVDSDLFKAKVIQSNFDNYELTSFNKFKKILDD